MSSLLDTVKDLKARSADLYRQARSIDTAVVALQTTCKHNWKCNGHGHNETYYTCVDCGKEYAE